MVILKDTWRHKKKFEIPILFTTERHNKKNRKRYLERNSNVFSKYVSNHITMHLASKENKDPKNSLHEYKDFPLNMKGDGTLTNRSTDVCSDFSSVSSFTVYSNKEYLDNKRQLAEKLNHKLQDVLQALKNYDKGRSGKVLPSNLYNVLNVFCHRLSFQDFKELIRKEKLDENGYISYKHFISKLTNKKREVDAAWQDKNNNKIVLNESNTEEIEVKMKQKITKNLKNFIRSMWLYDYNQDGLIQKQEFRSVLENYGFSLSDEQFNRFWNLYDPNRKGVINYEDFLLKLGARSEVYKRVIPRDMQSKVGFYSPLYDTKQEQVEKRCAKLGRDDPAIQGQVVNNVIEVFKSRVEKNFPILLRTFQIKYGCEDGLIPISVFHQVLNYFVMPMSTQLFKQVLMRFNISLSANKIQWYEFLKSVCSNKDVNFHTDISQLTRSHSWTVCKSIMEKLKSSGENCENFFKVSFTMMDQNNNRTITRTELRRTINLFLVKPLSEEEFRSLLFILDPGHTNVINCQKFLSLLNASSKAKSEKTSEDLSNKGGGSETTAHLTGERLKTEFKRSFNKNFKNIEKAVNAFDFEESGVMHVKELRKIVESFCFHLNDEQSREIFGSFITSSNKIFYNDFYKHYKKTPYEDEEKWAHCVRKLTTQNPPKRVEKDDILRQVKYAITAHKEQFLEEFKAQDYCSAGIAKKETLSKLLNKFVFRLTEEQFNTLWNLLPVNDIGFLKYEEFLEHFSNPEGNKALFVRSSSCLSLSSHSSSRPKTASSTKTSLSYRSCRRPKSAASHCSSDKSIHNDRESEASFLVQGQGCSVLTNQQYTQFKSLNFRNVSTRTPPSRISSAGDRLADGSLSSGNKCYAEKEAIHTKSSSNEKYLFLSTLKARWRDILRRCKVRDTENNNSVTWDAFQSILQQIGISESDEIQSILNSEFNLRRDFPVNYWMFLKKLLLTLKPSGYSRGTNGMSTDSDCVGLSKVLLNNRDKILKNYRDLRHAFRRGDRRSYGTIRASEFRKILALHKINLAEDDFFYICDYFDPKLTEQIPYDEFLRAFAQN